jgi:hypothetical protein
VTQPDYVPIAAPDRIRPIDRLPVPRSWRSTRPGEALDPVPPQGRAFGSTGPDLGYGLKLARLLVPKIKVTEGELAADAVAGCFAVGAKRAAMFGRAPVIFDMELAYALWGFLDGAPADLIAFRKPLFMGAAHEYWEQRQIVDRVKESTLRMTVDQAKAQLSDWKSLLV